jgi:hypothetical protein
VESDAGDGVSTSSFKRHDTESTKIVMPISFLKQCGAASILLLHSYLNWFELKYICISIAPMRKFLTGYNAEKSMCKIQ